MKKSRLPILTVYRFGKEFDRFLIKDEKKRVWTGERFDSGCASLYSNPNDACFEVHRILKKQFEGMEPKRYVVPCFIEVFGHEPITEGEIANYLSTGAKLTMDLDKYGNGPGDNSLVLPVIHWQRIEELPNG